jgi:hypothetical protein
MFDKSREQFTALVKQGFESTKNRVEVALPGIIDFGGRLLVKLLQVRKNEDEMPAFRTPPIEVSNSESAEESAPIED